ncbi:MAG: glycoside hydrolase N-terminal domain-containing protein, partial [Oscillospiraceae bacterium]|nr:glycoside hydrolase N-terminal domain-containing protein [Oscillospiraceae bacterium]
MHKAYTLTFARQEAGISDYLRFVDLYSGLVTTRWNQADGEYKNEYLAVYGDDLVAMRLTAPKGKLDLDIALDLPSKQGRYGRPAMVNSSNTLDKSAEMITVAWAYNPEYGKKGYAFALRFLLTGGESTVTEKGLCVKGADSLVILSKVAFYPKDFAFGCEEVLAKALLSESGDFDAYIAKSRAVLGEKMGRSYLTLGKGEDYLLSGEELLRRSRNELFLDPELMDKLYDMGRFYQLIDTGSIPPMWGQHNINTNLQVCAGNNTGLFDEMNVYFRYYEDKFEDFRTNARLLYGARGLLASVHCDPDSGLYYHFSRTYPHYAWTGCLGWIYNEFWGYWLCTGDREFLRTRVVPALEEIALFFEDYACLKDENGKSIFVPSFSPEDPTPNPDYVTVTSKSINPTRINSVMDIAICREVLQNLITACNTLEINQDRIAHWEAQLASLPDLLADEEGALKEWAWPTIEENYNHRHVSHHYDLWPGRAVTTDTEPEIAESIRISNRKRGQQDDSAHGIIHRTLCAIRLRDMEELEQDLTQLIGHGFV